MPHKQMSMERARPTTTTIRPFMLAIAGDSAAGKTTLAGGLVEALGADRSTSICTDDYHRYDRAERKEKPFTALHPDCNYISIMEQHLQLIATGQPILKPVYNHEAGTLDRPQLVEPMEFVIVEGLLPLHTKLMRSCFDVTVYLDPPEDIRTGWKLSRDTGARGYTKEQVLAELERREPESEEFIRAQRAAADIVVQFAPIPGRDDPPDTPLSATVLLRPTVPHPPMVRIVEDTNAIHLKMMRDDDERPVDALHVHGYAPEPESGKIEQRLWEHIGLDQEMPTSLGMLGPDKRSAPLAVTQLILLSHLLSAQS
ncbi:MAG: phosphoribulokinase [Pseudonocardiales bacterium]|nr:MAG: phosphoribulokinase [Pseudonocardiales bacterium]